MFWKKAAASSEKEAAPASIRESDDPALDTVASLLKVFGEHAFDTDNVTAAETRSECEGWAQRITVGAGKSQPTEGEAKPFRRDFGGVRRYFSAQRSHEREFVGRSLGNLREAVHAFARCLTTTVGEDRAADERVGAQLGKLVGAFQSNDSEAIRHEAEGIVSVVQEVMAKRSESQKRMLGELSQKIAELRDELQEVRERAALDPLTQLFNRAALDAHLDRVADLAFLLSSSPCILMIDVDHFKKTNDSYGHPAGDEVLRGVADMLVRNFLRREDFVARYGGEEFVVVIPDSSLNNAELRAERVRQSISELDITTSKGKVQVTVSIGLACLSSGDTGASWLARADAALYEAKGGGRNCVRVARDKASAVLSIPPSSSLTPGPRSLPAGPRSVSAK
ncbi:MAG TPA: GGDEF domain-containing protein [Polyangiaceae bacterium]|jgi:diguanylate cyclase|nr:GGDEF domain-containing protein [Polyangiaceae bacterium]